MIESGHSWPDIQGYTLNQVGLFVREGANTKDVSRKNALYTAWMGTNAGKDTINDLLKKTKKAKASDKSAKNDWIRLARDLRGIAR